MKIVIKIFCLVWGLACIVSFCRYLAIGDFLNAIAILVIGVLFSLPIFLWKSDSKIANEIQIKLKGQGFSVSKSVSFPNGCFYIDDIGKRFAVVQNRNIIIFDYIKMGAFELNEDGNSITQGKGLATIVGGMTFGILGAFVGNSGKRKNDSTCSNLTVRILINDLQCPQIVIPYIHKEIKKATSKYKKEFESAKSLIALLSYIENQ